MTERATHTAPSLRDFDPTAPPPLGRIHEWFQLLSAYERREVRCESCRYIGNAYGSERRVPRHHTRDGWRNQTDFCTGSNRPGRELTADELEDLISWGREMDYERERRERERRARRRAIKREERRRSSAPYIADQVARVERRVERFAAALDASTPGGHRVARTLRRAVDALVTARAALERELGR